MVVSSDGEYVQNIPILHTLNCDRLLLRNECLPVLLGVSRLQPTKTNATTSALHRINQFILRSQKCSDIEHYWTQATKLLSGSKPTFSRISTFETARVIDRFWMVHNDLICLDPHQADGEWRSNSIFNERSYLHVLNSIIPILVSCFQKSEASQLIKVMISSQLAAEHLSNLAVNLPSLCGIISEVLLSCLRNAQDAAVVWRCSRVLLSIAAKDKDLAICVRTCMVRRKEHPSLCLEVTNKFIHDADSFIDIELCSPSSAHNNSSICSSWLVNSLRDCNLQQISELMVSRLNFLATGRISTATQEQFSETARGMKMAPTDHWQDDIIRCARIISTCSSIRGSCSDNRMSNLSSNSPDFYGKIDMLDAAAKTLITAAHGILERLKRSYEVIRTEENEENEKVEVEFMLRIAIVLLLVGFTVSATAFVKLREDNNQNQIHIQNYLEKSKLLDKESKLTSLLISAIQGQKQLVEMDCTSFDNRTKNPDSAAEAARTHILFFSLAVTYGCHTGLRSLSTDLSLSQYNDFMTDVELKRVLLVLGKGLVIPEGERDRNLILKQVKSEFVFCCYKHLLIHFFP